MTLLLIIFAVFAACPLAVGWACRGGTSGSRLLAAAAVSFVLAVLASTVYATFDHGISVNKPAMTERRETREIVRGRVVDSPDGLALDVVFRDTQTGDEWEYTLVLAPALRFSAKVFALVFILASLASFGVSSIPLPARLGVDLEPLGD